MPTIEILSLIGIGLTLSAQIIQLVSQGTFKSNCCDGCITIEHEDNKNPDININITHDDSG